MRHGAGDAVDGIETRHHEVAPLDERLGHGVHAVLRAGEGLDGRHLRKRRRVAGALALQMAAGGDHVGRTGAEPQAPTGHGVGLGDAVDHDAAFLQRWRQRGDADLLQPVVHHVLVYFVGDDVEAGVVQHVGEVLQLFGGVHRAGGVARAVEDDALGCRCQVAPQHRAGDFETFRRGCRNDHRHAAGHLHLRRVSHPVRTGNDHLVARIHQHHRQVVQDVLGAA